MTRTLSYIRIISAKKIVSVYKIIEEKFIRYKMGLLKVRDKSFHPSINMKINWRERCQNLFKWWWKIIAIVQEGAYLKAWYREVFS